MELKEQLNAKQGLGLEIELLRESLLVMKHLKDDKNSKFKQKIDDIQNDLQEKEDDLECLVELTEAIVVKERKSNNELQEARKELINVSILF